MKGFVRHSRNLAVSRACARSFKFSSTQSTVCQANFHKCIAIAPEMRQQTQTQQSAARSANSGEQFPLSRTLPPLFLSFSTVKSGHNYRFNAVVRSFIGRFVDPGFNSALLGEGHISLLHSHSLSSLTALIGSLPRGRQFSSVPFAAALLAHTETCSLVEFSCFLPNEACSPIEYQ